MNRNKVLELAREAGLERIVGVYKDGSRMVEVPQIELFERFAALIEAEMCKHQADKFCETHCSWTDHHVDCDQVRWDAEPVAWLITRKTAKNGLQKSAVLGSYSWASAHCDVGSPEPLYSHSASVNAEPVGTVKELFTNSALERLDLRPSTKVYIAPPTPAASAESVASVHIKDGCLIGSQRKSGVDIPDGQYGLYPIGTFPSSAVVRQLVDALSGLIDFIEIDNLKIDQDALRIARASLSAAKDAGL